MKTKQVAHLAALTALGALTAGVWQISRAHADTPTPATNEQQFIAAARAIGVDNTDAQILRDGFIVCAADSQGGVNDDLIERGIGWAQRFLGNPVTDPELDAKFTDLANQYLCPSAAVEKP